MISIFGAGPASAIAAALLTTIGSSAPALAQNLSNPVTQAVAAVATPVVAAPAAIVAAPSLETLVAANVSDDALDEQSQCLATAVYFESRGEPLDGQLAVANVVINRAHSGKYPTDWCGVVKQKAQFSFVRNGQFPHVDANCAAWDKARAIARIAAHNLTSALPDDVLWYHANYVAPSWGKRLTRASQIGAHIFYRA